MKVLSGYRLQLDESFYQVTNVSGIQSVAVIGSIKTPEYFDGDISVKAEAVTLEKEDTSKSKIDEATQTLQLRVLVMVLTQIALVSQEQQFLVVSL